MPASRGRTRLHPGADAAASLPDQSPSPVLRIGQDGTLLYANRASEPVMRVLDVRPGDRVPDDFLRDLAAMASADPSEPAFELVCDLQTFAIRAVQEADGRAWDVYGIDITGAKVSERFPDQNPNPVLRSSLDGRLTYANPASEIVLRALGIAVGDAIPNDLMERISARLDGASADPVWVSGEGHIIEIEPVHIADRGFINLYGTDVTAVHAVTAFPDENPNPVLRIDRTGRLVYANPASAPLQQAFGAWTGETLSAELWDRLRLVAAGPQPNTMEVEADGRVFELRVVSLPRFESVNLYGTDVTAQRDVQRLLLNILPAPIVERLQQGETMIADRFEEMGVLFADVVDFTPFSSSHPPAEVVRLLNQVFTTFDHLADRHGLEKIKTIGDAYMVAGGITPEGGQIEHVADMALDAIDASREFRTEDGIQLQIRVGLHIGPAIGGIIGIRKFIYDFWGDTVNTASRLESHGVPGAIQVTAETAARLASSYVCERRGLIDLKGKGRVNVYFLTGRKA